MALTNYTIKGEKTFGSRLADDLGQILEGVAQQKAMHVKRSQTQQALHSAGIKPDIAKWLSHQPDDFLSDFLKNSSGLQIGAAQGYDQNQPQQQQDYGQFQPSQGQMSPQNQPSGDVNEVLRALSANPALAQQINPAQLGQLLQSQATQQALNPAGNGQQSPITFGKQADSPQVAGQEQQAKQAIQTAQTIINQGKEAKRKLKIVNKMEELAKSGKLSGGTWSRYARALGTSSLFGLGVSDETERFDKLSEQLVPENATEQQIISARSKVPNIGHSQKAKLAIIKDFKEDYQEQIQQAEQTQRIIQQNGGRVPFNIDQLVGQQQNQGLQLIEESNNPQEGDKAQGPNGQWYKFTNGKWNKA